MSSWRAKTLLLGFFLFALVIIIRLFYWQFIQGEKLLAQAESQYLTEQNISAPRGKIFTADNFPIVSNQKTYLLYTNPKSLTVDKEKVVFDIASIVENDPLKVVGLKGDLDQKINQNQYSWVPLLRNLSQFQKDEILKLNVNGLGFDEEEKRFYPEGSMSAHLFGFVGKNSSGQNQGYFGLEGFYDRELQGKPGVIRQEKDAQGLPIPIGRISEEEGINGRDLTLYLDRGIQYITDKNLKDGIEKYGASAGLVIVMDPKTGGIVAMSSYPNYDPNNYSKEDKSLFSNPVIAQTFEPGSIFKILIMASALNDKVIKPYDICALCSGPRVINSYSIKTWDEKYHPGSTMVDIIKNSDNVGMVYVEEKLGKDRLLSYLDLMGFGKLTGIDLEEETSAVTRPKDQWSDIDLATVSFGQGIAVTPIQMITAGAAIANGGKIMEPHVVKKIKVGDKEIEIKPKVINNVFDKTATIAITEMMVNAVEKGEAKWAKPKGYSIAGKTGTAQIPIAGHYDKDKTIASFIGFAPASDPRFIMLITLKEPKTSPWGSETAAPLWFKIAKEIFNVMGIPPDSDK